MVRISAIMRTKVRRSVRPYAVIALSMFMAAQNVMMPLASVASPTNIVTDSKEETPESDGWAEPVSETMKTFRSGAMQIDNTVGDLWNRWGNVDTSWYVDTAGDSADNPYVITNRSELMGLSVLVAAGNRFEGEYIQLRNHIDLTGLGFNWNPIGWYQNQDSLGTGDQAVPFSGHFDGNGKTISGFKVIDTNNQLNDVGLFGYVKGGSITNMTVKPEHNIQGQDNVGILAGRVEGDTVIRNVTVEGLVAAEGDAGGLVGEITGAREAYHDTVTIENCHAEVTITSGAEDGYVGGIAGNVQNANLVDVSVRTYNDPGARVTGQGFVGGIAGRLNKGSIFNSYFTGTVGGNGTEAVGGIVGKYVKGNIIVARMDGTVAHTNQSVSAYEGTFVGMKEATSNFTYGTGTNDQLAYLFAGNAEAARTVFGTTRDNTFTSHAHIGYWADDTERNFHIVYGDRGDEEGAHYFHKELENGILHIIRNKLGNDATLGEYDRGCDFQIDHVAPNHSGKPVRGYLVSIPQINANRADGGTDQNVATLIARGPVTNAYYEVITKDAPGAIAPGDAVTVSTSANNTNGNRYQLVYNELKPGSVEPPTYTDEDRQQQEMSYTGAGTFHFTMPAADTELNVRYLKVTTEIDLEPTETVINIVQERSGDRKQPVVVTKIYSEDGTLIGKVDGTLTGNSVIDGQTYVRIHATNNGSGSSADRTVRWSIDDTDLIVLTVEDENAYTDQPAKLYPNLDSRFIQDVIADAVGKQVDSGYAAQIDNTVYEKIALVTASTKPDTSADNQVVTANTTVKITFQIKDMTQRKVTGIDLSQPNIGFTVTRTLTGDRLNPTETYTVNDQTIANVATLVPENVFEKNVTWSVTEGVNYVTVIPSGTNNHTGNISVVYGQTLDTLPGWIKAVVEADNSAKVSDPYRKLTGSATETAKVTATANDQSNAVYTADCHITLNFVTNDQTVIRPTGGSGVSSGGGGGGGSSSGGKKSTSDATKSAAALSLPEYVIKNGTWVEADGGIWQFREGSEILRNRWAAVYNPYADEKKGQSPFDWFRFDANGNMVSGWFTDFDGNVYYLHTTSDGTLGRMYVGWNWITGADGRQRCYYFNPVSDGYRGKLMRDTEVIEGDHTYRVNADGEWTVNGVVQIR